MKALIGTLLTSKHFKQSMRKASVLLLIAGAVGLLAGCDSSLSIQERQLLDARHDHLRCEVYLDRLRDLYQVTRDEEDGLMEYDQLDPGPGSVFTRLTGGADGPLTGGHDGPLTGGHDGPLTGGHDGPLTGGHDYQENLLEELVAAKEGCWSAVNRLVEDYNFCVENYVEKKNCGAAGQLTCLGSYDSCLGSARVQKLLSQSD